MTQETVSPRGGSQAVRAARRDEAALLGEVLADAFADDPVFAWLIPPQLTRRRPSTSPRASCALYRFAAFAPSDGGRGYVVDGPLTTLYGDRWPIDDNRFRARRRPDHTPVTTAVKDL